MSERFAAGELERFIAGVMTAEGLPGADAADVARLMVAADRTGFDAHGIFRLPDYLKRIRSGGINKTPQIGILRETASVAVVDGDNGMGHLAVEFAARAAIGKASQTGIGWAGTRDGNHAGAASVYAAMPLAHGMIGIYGAVGGGNQMPPWGGADLLLSTNPLAVAIPAGDGTPVVMDFATTVASMGKIRATAQRGEAILPRGAQIAAPSVEINFENRGTPQREVSREVRLDPRGLIVTVVTEDLDGGGPASQAIARRFGLRDAVA